MSKMVERFLTYCRESEVDLQVFDVPDDADLVGVVSGNFYFYFRDESVTVRFYREAGGRFKARDVEEGFDDLRKLYSFMNKWEPRWQQKFTVVKAFALLACWHFEIKSLRNVDGKPVLTCSDFKLSGWRDHMVLTARTEDGKDFSHCISNAQDLYTSLTRCYPSWYSKFRDEAVMDWREFSPVVDGMMKGGSPLQQAVVRRVAREKSPTFFSTEQTLHCSDRHNVCFTFDELARALPRMFTFVTFDMNNVLYEVIRQGLKIMPEYTGYVKIRDISYCPYDLNLNRDGRFNSHVFIRIEFRHTSYYAEVMEMYITVNLKCLKDITIDIFLNDSDAHPADNFGPIVKYKYQEDLSVSIQNAVCEYLRKAFFKDEREAWCKNFGLLHRDEIAWGFFGYGDFYEEVKKRS